MAGPGLRGRRSRSRREKDDMRTLIAIVVAGLILLPGAVTADELINNGLAPPNPANVIDDVDSGSTVYVRNVGCPPGWGEPEVGPEDPCPSPGALTRVAFVEGGVRSGLVTKDSSALTITGGTLSNSLHVNDLCAATMTDGSALAAHIRQSSTFRMTGGSIGSNLATYDSTILRMSGGFVEGRLIAYGSANVTMSGGIVEDGLIAASFSTVTLAGGSVEGYVSSESSSNVTISGGTVGAELRAKHFSTTTIVGRHFAVDGVPVPYEDLTAQTGILTGTLASGERIENLFYQGGGSYTGTITLVESPGLPSLSPWSQLALMASLLGAGLGVWRRRAIASSPA
jgi:hypothetical protein